MKLIKIPLPIDIRGLSIVAGLLVYLFRIGYVLNPLLAFENVTPSCKETENRNVKST